MKTRMVRGYAWFPQYIYPWESQWSLLHKFARWNVLGVQALYRAVGRGINVTVNLMSGQFIDEGKFASATGMSSDDVRNSLCTNYLLPGDRSLIVPSLRFCPDCLALGYHSVVHQFLLFDKCLVHGLELQTGCPGCHALISTEMTGSNLKRCFRCPCCNYEFSDVDRPGTERLRVDIMNVIRKACDELLLIRQVKESADITSSFDVRAMEDRLHMLWPLWRSAFAGVSEQLCHTVHQLRPSWLNPWTIYKSVHRAIVRHHMREHRRCLFEIQALGGAYAGYRCQESVHCPEVHAYMLWRMYWESRVCFADLHLDMRISDFDRRSPSELTARESQTVFAHECLTSFNMLLECARSMDRQGEFMVMTRDQIDTLLRGGLYWMVEKRSASKFKTIHCWAGQADAASKDDNRREENGHNHFDVQRAVQRIQTDLRSSGRTCHTHSFNRGVS